MWLTCKKKRNSHQTNIPMLRCARSNLRCVFYHRSMIVIDPIQKRVFLWILFCIIEPNVQWIVSSTYVNLCLFAVNTYVNGFFSRDLFAFRFHLKCQHILILVQKFLVHWFIAFQCKVWCSFNEIFHIIWPLILNSKIDHNVDNVGIPKQIKKKKK